jgi:hypothetical protein
LRYNREVAAAVRRIKHPYPGRFTVDMVEYPDGRVGVRVYESQINELNDFQKVTAMEFLNLVVQTVESFGLKSHIEGEPGVPPRKQ